MDGFTFRVVGSTGCEILNPNGEVFAWTVNEVWAVMIVALLNREEKSERQSFPPGAFEDGFEAPQAVVLP